MESFDNCILDAISCLFNLPQNRDQLRKTKDIIREELFGMSVRDVAEQLRAGLEQVTGSRCILGSLMAKRIDPTTTFGITIVPSPRTLDELRSATDRVPPSNCILVRSFPYDIVNFKPPITNSESIGITSFNVYETAFSEKVVNDVVKELRTQWRHLPW
jgi:hypothetical protein